MWARDDENGSIVCATLFGVLTLACLFNFKLTRFKVYLLSGLSSAFRTIGYATRAASWAGSASPNTDLLAPATVFAAAGFGIAVAVQTLVMGCWFKNADVASKPSRSWPTLSVGVRLLIAPIVAFGPILGIAITALIYGVATEDSITTALRLRLAASWGLFGCTLVLLALEGYAVGTAARDSRASARRDPNKLVYLTFLCGCLLLFSLVFRVVCIYRPQYDTNPCLYYPLIALPQLLQLAICCVPRLMARMGMAARYEAWQADALGGGAGARAAGAGAGAGSAGGKAGSDSSDVKASAAAAALV
eukprot:scaffold7.g3495.t1